MQNDSIDTSPGAAARLYVYSAVLFVVAAVPCCVVGFARFESNMEDVFQWLPDQSTERSSYEQFVTLFGTDDFVVIWWPGVSLEDPRLIDLAERLRASSDPYIQEIVAGSDVMEQLLDAGLEREEILRRFEGIYFPAHGEGVCLLAAMTPTGMSMRKKAIASIENVAREVLKDEAEELILGGYPRVGAYGDEIIKSSLFMLVIPSCLISTVVAWICLRSVRLTLAVLMVAGLAAALSVAAVTLSGAKWGGVSSVIPSLAYILTVSGSLHLVNYGRSFTSPSASQILRCGCKPCSFSALTTAAGMLSLCRSSFPAVREFGWYCASGVLISLVCQLVLMPVLISWLDAGRTRAGAAALQDFVLSAVLRRRGFVVVTGVTLILLFALGFRALRAELEVERVFAKSSLLIQEMEELEASLGPIEQTELVVTFADDGAKSFEDRLRIVRRISGAVRDLPQVATTLSLASSLPDPPESSSLNAVVRRAIFRRRLRNARENLGETSYLAITPGAESWRISLRFPFLAKTDFSDLSSSALATASEVLRDEGLIILGETHPTATSEGMVGLRYTGVTHLYHVAQENVIRDLVMNCVLAFVLICPLMMIAVRSIGMGLVAMIPNVLPMIGVYGGLGLIGYPLDIGMAMTACVALGIAVDDTTHFLIRFRDMERTSPSALRALQSAYRQCSSAMFQTTLIAGLGLTAFLVGPLAAMTRFSATLIALLVVALLCDLLLLPALISFFGASNEVNSAEDSA